MKGPYLTILLIFAGCTPDEKETTPSLIAHFQQLEQANWKEVFHDPCTEDWTQRWTLDGTKATITHSQKGMDYFSGPNRGEDSSHAVLWTKQSFTGDIRIDYEYTKIEDVIEAVTILYIQATGNGLGNHHADISKWANQRETASMRKYFLNMHLYHISYAAFEIGNANPERDYIRARRYLPENENALAKTNLKPDFFETGLFKQNIPHKITVIKKGNDLFMRIRNNEKEQLCHWKTDSHPPVTEGRIGLRHMWTRGARYQNFRISQISAGPR